MSKLTERQFAIVGIMFGDGSMSVLGGSIQIAVTGQKVEDNSYLINHAWSPWLRRNLTQK
jgi:hypothetical protein